MIYLLPLFLLLGLSYQGYSQLTIDFYGQKLAFEYDYNVILKKKFSPNEKDFAKFYETILKSGYKVLLDRLQTYKRQFQLNDLLYYSLIDKVCSSLDKRDTNSSYLKWFLLGKSDYKLQVAFSKNHVSIFAESDELIHGLPKFNKSYCLNCGGQNLTEHFFKRFNPYRNNKTKFSFYFNPLPNFNETSYLAKTFRLESSNSAYKEEMVVQFDSALLSCLHEVENYNLQQTFSVPLTQNAKKLLDRMDEITDGYSDSMRVSYLMDFVVKNSAYSPDRKTFDKGDKWATPEEFLFYGTGDCEDRSSFMYYSLKEILRKPIVIVVYSNINHVNVAVSLKLTSPPNFFYKGKPYYICETTVDNGFTPLGNSDLVKKNKFEIIGEYTPDEKSKN